jgi:D-threo-aldose 1-dehydrogenase
MGLGTAPIGNQFRFVPDADARAVIDGAWEAGLRYFDTAPFYGNGISELRLGEALRWRPRDEYVLSTKVGRLLKPKPRKEIESRFWIDPAPFEVIHDYSYDGAMRSFEDSLQRMALERIEIAFIHDIDNFSHPPDVQKAHFRTAMNGAYKALDKLRSEGLVKAIGVGCNEWQAATRRCASATSTAFCLPAATLCSNRRRSTRSYRFANSETSQLRSGAAITAASSQQAPSRARIITIAPLPSQSWRAFDRSRRCASSLASR